MLDDLDDGARIGVWTALGVVAFLLFGLLGGLALKSIGPGKGAVAVAGKTATGAAAAAGTAALAPVAAAADPDALLEGPIAGDVVGTLYFALGQAALPDDAAAPISAIKAALEASPNRKLVISGFHDAAGDPAKNAELAKDRAKAVRAALLAGGVAGDRIALRKPESTTGDGSDREARRVEARLLP